MTPVEGFSMRLRRTEVAGIAVVVAGALACLSGVVLLAPECWGGGLGGCSYPPLFPGIAVTVVGFVVAMVGIVIVAASGRKARQQPTHA